MRGCQRMLLATAASFCVATSNTPLTFLRMFAGSSDEPSPQQRQRTVRFGTESNYVSNPRKTARDRAAYIARHRVNENHGDPLTPGALSRWLLWGESRSLARNTAAFRRRFRLQ